MPFENAYFPLAPFLVAVLSTVCGASESRTYHILTAFGYCMGPVGLYVLGRELSRSWRAAFFAGMTWSLTSASAMLFPEILSDLGGLGLDQRLKTIVCYGAGPQNLALALLPWALWILQKCLYPQSTPRCKALFLAAAAITASTNAFGAVSMILTGACLYVANRPGRNLLVSAGNVAATTAAGYCLLIGVVSPLVLRTIFLQSQHTAGDFR